ncbi:tectonic-3-like [Lampris incognitus]|uniref:tectonic-3-like n=1 Tax=Lampris incognitus TaxID=2546036 RepID=UPI0024B4F398|nr:tectonic-3-like [Lampris incognitus]
MYFRHLVIVVFWSCWAHPAAGAGVTSGSPPTTRTSATSEGPLSSAATPEPETTSAAQFTSTGTDGSLTVEPGSSAFTSPTPPVPSTAGQTTDVPNPATTKPSVTPPVCLCDLSPGFCDVGCCCDTADCGVADLSTVFSGCSQKAISGTCIEKWLMFRTNVDPTLVTVTDSLVCVRPEGMSVSELRQPPPALPEDPALGESYHFSPPNPMTASLHARPFYRVDDVILTYFSKSSIWGLLGQPSPGAATTSCVNSNPARFLRSVSLSCTRSLTPQSCSTEPSLNARSYFSDFSLVKVPVKEAEALTDLLVPVSPLSDWPAPTQHNNSCLNVVSTVEFTIGFTGRGELVYVTVNVVLTDVDANQVLLQKHSVKFQLASPRPSPEPKPAVGLRPGSPVMGRFGKTEEALTILGALEGGQCSLDPNRRVPVFFTHNAITGCMFSSRSRDCSELRSQLYEVLQGRVAPSHLAMNSGSSSDWSRVLVQHCSVSPQETCESGCLLPLSLSVRVLWARLGSLHLPQNYILGAKYHFHCHVVQCPLSSSLALTTEVRFGDSTVYPEFPRGQPRPDWKFPFGFFSRGADELDGHIINPSGDL